MIINKCKWFGAGVASLVIGSYSVSLVNAEDEAIAEPTVIEAPDAEVEGGNGHVHDENCNHPELIKPPTVEEIRTFLAANAAYILPEFNKVIEGGDEEHMTWMMKDIARVMDEHSELNKFDPKVATVFSEVLKLENDLHQSIESKLEAGEKPEAIGSEIKAQLNALIAKRIELQKGQVAYKKAQLDLELKSLEEATQNVGEITEKELKAIILELKQTEEGQE